MTHECIGLVFSRRLRFLSIEIEHRLEFIEALAMPIVDVHAKAHIHIELVAVDHIRIYFDNTKLFDLETGFTVTLMTAIQTLVSSRYDV